LRRGPHVTTTRQAEVLNIALAARPGWLDRLVVGRNVRTGAAVTYDPFVSYADPREPQFTSTVISVIGNLGMGKSTLMKVLFVARTLLLGRRVVVLDKKRQGAAGEYAPIANALGTQSVRFVPGGGPGSSRINLIDPRIGVATADGGATSEGRPAGQLELVQRVIATYLGQPLGALGIEALRVGLLAAPRRAAAAGREPDVYDLIWCLQHPDPDQIRDLYDGSWSAAQLAEWGTEAAAALLVLVNGELSGVIDGPTSPEVSVDHPSGLTVFDISALPNSGAALGIVMLLIQTWLAGLLARRATAREQTVLVVEEGWHVASGDLGEMFKEQAKLSRALGLCLVAGFHHPSDLPQSSPARALMQESSTWFLFGQDKPTDIEETLKIAQLPVELAPVLAALPRGQCLLVKAGADPEHVDVGISDWEAELTNTDAQLIGETGGP
jgi:DNA helicase HerA-like ATPase